MSPLDYYAPSEMIEFIAEIMPEIKEMDNPYPAIMNALKGKEFESITLREYSRLNNDRAWKLAEKKVENVYRLGESISAYKKVAKLFLDSKDLDDHIIFIWSEYNKKMCVPLLNNLLEKMDIEPIPSRLQDLFYSGDLCRSDMTGDELFYANLMYGAFIPSFLRMIFDEKITDEDILEKATTSYQTLLEGTLRAKSLLASTGFDTDTERKLGDSTSPNSELSTMFPPDTPLKLKKMCAIIFIMTLQLSNDRLRYFSLEEETHTPNFGI